MAQLNFPSMFDTRHAMDRQMQDDAHKAAVAGGGGKRYGMYYNSSLLGDQDIARKRNLLGMFGLGGDPRMQQQNALDEIMARFPNPQTPDDFVEISNALSGAGLHSYAEAAMDMANETRSSMPKSTYTTVKVGDTDEEGNRITKTILYKDGQPFKELGSQATDAPSIGKGGYKEVKTEDPTTGIDKIETYQTGVDGLIVPDSKPVFTRTPDSDSSQTYGSKEFKTEDPITGEDKIETWKVDVDGQIMGDEPLFTQIKDAGGASTSMGLAMQLLQDNPEFKTAVANNHSPTINRMIKETLAAITPDEVKDRPMRLVDKVWRFTDGEQEKVFSDQNIPENPDAKAEEIYAEYLEKHPDLFNTPEGNIRLAKDLVAAKLTSTKIFSDLMGSVGQDGQNAIRQEELTVRAMERLSDNYVDSGVGGMDSLLAPIEASIAANMKQVVNKDGQVVWKGQLPGWDLTSSLDKWLPGSKGYAARQFAGQAASLINTVLRQRSGAAVTSHEWDRLVQEFTGGRIKTSAQFANWVGRMRDYNEKTKGYIMAGYEPVVQNRFMANMGSYMTIDPETELNLVPMGGWFISSTDGKVYRKDK